MKVKQWKVADVKPYPGNPRATASAVEAVAASIRRFGFRQPIVVDRDGVIVCGHVRYQAAVLLGLESVPVHVADDLSPEQARAYRLADNKTGELADWDLSLLAEEASAARSDGSDLAEFGFDPADLAALLEESDAAALQPLSVKPLPKMAWVLIGIPAVRFADIASDVERWASLPDVFCEATVSDEEPHR